MLCRELPRLGHSSGVELLEAVLAKNPHREVQAHACYALGKLLKRRAEEESDPKLTQRARGLFERFMAEYAQVAPDLEERAGRMLSELRRLTVGKVAPEIEGKDLKGRKMKLSDYRGQVVLLTFWGTWCGPCMERLPHKQELSENFAQRPFAVVGVNSDDDRQEALRAVKEHGITWRSFWNQGTRGPISTAWNIEAWPSNYLIDRQGVIRYKDLSGKELEEAVKALLREDEK